MTDLRTAAQQALDEWHTDPGSVRMASLMMNLGNTLAEPVQTQQENTMPITDDNGQALRPQYRVIERHGNWQLLYDPLQIGETMIHEFRIQKFRHDIALYPGISLAEAQKRFRERVEADNE